MRMVSWRKLYDQDVWRCKSPAWGSFSELDLAFEVRAGMRNRIISRNPVLEIKARREGERYHKEILLSKEFNSTWKAKHALDCLLYIMQLQNKSPEDARNWLLEQVSAIPDADKLGPLEYEPRWSHVF